MGELNRLTSPEEQENQELKPAEPFFTGFIHRIEGMAGKIFGEETKKELQGALGEQVDLFRELARGIKEGGLGSWDNLDAPEKKKVVAYGLRAVMLIIGAEIAVPPSAESQEVTLADSELTLEPDESGNIDIHFGYSTQEAGELKDVKVASALSFGEIVTASRFKGFEIEASKYLNTQTHDAINLKNGGFVNKYRDYFFIPKEEIDKFLNEENFDANGERITDPGQIQTEGANDKDRQQLIIDTNNFLSSYESRDGKYYIIPDSPGIGGDYARSFKMPEQQVDLTRSEIRQFVNQIPANYEEFGLTQSDYIAIKLDMLEALSKIDFKKSDIQNYDSAHPEKTSFALSAEERRAIEENFLAHLKQAGAGYSEQEKLVALATLGDVFFSNFDDQLFETNQGRVGEGELPLAEFLLAAKAHEVFGLEIPIGVCRQINQKIPEIAQIAFGMEAITKSTYSRGMHVIGGVRLEDGTIAFLNYGNVIKTGTADLPKAASFYERDRGRIEGTSVVGDASGVMRTHVKSRATKSREEAMHFQSGEAKLPEMLAKERIIETKDGLQVTIEREKQEIALGSRHLAASFIRLDPGMDPYNALEHLYGVRVEGKADTKRQSFRISTALLAEKLKGIDISHFSKTKEMAVETSWDYLRKFDLSKDFQIVMANALNSYCAINLDDQALAGIGGGESFGLKFLYISPDKPFELHVGAQDHMFLKFNNIQTLKPSDIQFHDNLRVLDVATRVQVSEKLSIGLATAAKVGDIYKGGSIGADLQTEGYSAQAKFEKKISDDVLFLPHSAQGEIELAKKENLGKKSTILTLYGSYEAKDYGQQKDSQFKLKAGLTLLF